MSSVDNMIVNMQFNNKQFTQGAAQSEAALKKLDQTIASTGKGGGLDTLAKGVQDTTGKFSAMKIAGVAAVATIASKATSAGLSLLKNLTIAPIMDGFREYTTNLNSIQTVMANTGADVDTVNGYMNKLNKYSDQTIYNFSEMAKNIGTFTAAGVDLETATSSIKGIANIAALSGSSSQQASTAMYQLSQAIAAGKVGLQDWNSVVNAGMGGKKLQTALATTAQAMGTVGKGAIGTAGDMERLTINGESFRQSISAAAGGESWLTSDVLTTTLSLMDGRLSKAALAAKGLTKAQVEVRLEQERGKLIAKGYSEAQADAMIKTANDAYKAATTIKSLPQLMQVVQESIGSMWSQAFQIILGDFTQSKKLWGDVGDAVQGILGGISGTFLGALRIWEHRGGRNKVIEGLSNGFGALLDILKVVTKAWRDVFPKSDVAGENVSVLFRLSKAFKSFTQNLIPSKQTLEDLRTIFGAFFSIVKVGFTIVSALAQGFRAFFGEIFAGSEGARGGLLSFVAGIAELITKGAEWLTSGNKLVDFMVNLGTIAGKAIGTLLSGIGPVVDAISAMVSSLDLSTMVNGFQNMDVSFSGLRDSLTAGIDRIKNAFNGASGPIEHVADSFGTLQEKVRDFLSKGVDLSSIFDSIGQTTGNLAAQGLEIGGQILAGIISGISSAGPALLGAIGDLAGGIIDGFKSVLGIHSPATAMIPIGINIMLGIGQGLGQGIAFIIQGFSKYGDTIKNAFNQLFGDMDAIDVAALVNSIFSGGLILALTKGVEAISTPFKTILKSGITGTFDQLGKTLKTFQTGIRAKALLDIAIAVGVLAGSIFLLSKIEPEKIGIALGAIASMMTMLVGSLAVLSKISSGGIDLVALAFSMTLISTALLQLSAAVAIFGNMDMVTMAKGFGAIGVGLMIMLGAMYGFSKIQGSIAGMAASMLVLSIALNVLAAAVLAFGSMNLGTLAQGLGGIAIGLFIMVQAMQGLDKMKSSPEGLGASILIMAAAMVVMAQAVGTLGGMDIPTLAKGLGAMAIGLALMVGALIVLSTMAASVMIAAQAMLIVSVALIAFAQAVGMLGAMDGGAIAKGLTAIAAGFVILIAAAFAAQFVAVGLIVLGTAILLLGQGLLMAGAGMLLFSAALTVLVALGVAAIALMAAAIEAFIALLPTIAVQVAASFVMFIETIAKAAPRVRAAFSTIFEHMLGVVRDAIPQIGKLMSQLITTGINVLTRAIPQFVRLGMTLINALLNAAAKEVPHIAEVATTMVLDFLSVIDKNLPKIIEKGTDIIVHLLEGLGKAAGRITDAAGQAILDILHAIDAAVVKYSGQIRDAGLDIAGHLIDGLTGGLASKLAGAIQSAFNTAVSSLPGPVVKFLGLNGRGKAGTDPFAAAGRTVTDTNTFLDATRSKGDPSVAAALATERLRSQNVQKRIQEAKAAEAVAKRLEDIAKKKDATKAQKDAAKDARKIADTKAGRVETAQGRYETASQSVDDTIAFRDADLQGKADIRADQATELAAKANELLAKANAEAARASKMKGKKAEEMQRQAVKDAAAAQALAAQAKAYQQEANKYLEQEILDRIGSINSTKGDNDKDRADAAAARAEQKAYDKADAAGKKDIMQARFDRDTAKAKTAQGEADRLIQLARSVAGTDAAKAAEYLDEAEKYAAEADEAADRAAEEGEQLTELAEQAAEEAKKAAEKAAYERELATQAAQQSGSIVTDSGQILTPSRTAMEDAAKAFDRYTESLASATESAAGTSSTVQYTQNIYAPTAPDPAEVYRQTKNLVSTSGVSPTP